MDLNLSMVCFGPGAQLSVPEMKRQMATRWPDLPEITDLKKEQSTISFNLGEYGAVLALMPAPIPWSDLEWPCESSWLWTDAEAALKSHEKHLIVTVFGQGEPIERLRVLTQVTAAVLASCPQAVGVFWCPARQVVQSPVFVEMATKISERPYYLWVNFQIGTNSQGTLSGYTIGMHSLGLMDLEVEDCPESKKDLHDRLVGVVHYLIDNGLVIKDGDTLGETQDEKITVEYADSIFGREERVMRLEYGPAGNPAQSPSKRMPRVPPPLPSKSSNLGVTVYQVMVGLMIAMIAVIALLMLFDPNGAQAKGRPMLLAVTTIQIVTLGTTLAWNLQQKRLETVSTILQVVALISTCLGMPLAVFGIVLLAMQKPKNA